jgi:hypothetical protein
MTMKAVITACVIIGFVFAAILALYQRYASSAEQRQMQSSLDDILMSQLRSEKREIERTPEPHRSQSDKNRLETIADEMKKIEARRGPRR